jgi:sugar/nucleoside kinase (ribokinase family)
MSAPDVVICGHASKDVVPGGWRMGGTVTFAAAQAHRLGMSVGVVTSAGDEVDVQKQLPFADVRQLASESSTTFENSYDHGRRRQRVHGRASPIAIGDVPRAWLSASIALVGPVLGEVDTALPAAFDDGSLVGVSPQGWLRGVDADGNVVRAPHAGAPFWRGSDAVFVSDEDLLGGRDDTAPWLADVPIVVMTESYRGAQVWSEGRWRRIDSFPGEEVDPTGAGDTFAMAFLIRFRETGLVAESARFGAAAASLSIAGIAAEATPSREEIEAHMRRYPEVTLT